MREHQRELARLLAESGALRFGEFTTKSGRPTPYFLDLGRIASGAGIAALGRVYARAIRERFEGGVDLLFGPAYKGIPIAVASAIALAAEGVQVGFAFDRKEAKDHGEGGRIVGHAPADGERVLLVEDVTTAGTSIRATLPLLRASARVEVAGLVVAVDRLERGPGGGPALAEVADELGAPVHAILDVLALVDELHGRRFGGQVLVDDARRQAVRAHVARFGPTADRT